MVSMTKNKIDIKFSHPSRSVFIHTTVGGAVMDVLPASVLILLTVSHVMTVYELGYLFKTSLLGHLNKIKMCQLPGHI